LLDSLYTQIGAIAWLAVCGFALWKGEKPERTAGGALLIAWLATLAIHRDTMMTDVHYFTMAIDVIVLGLLVALSWKSERTWPIWAAGFQLLTILVQIVPMFDMRIRYMAYLAAQTIATYGVLVCVGVGTFWAWQEREAVRAFEPD
jgi:hypothetical protein